MINYKGPGEVINTTPAATVSSGDVIICGAGIRVAVTDIAAGAIGAARARGVVTLAATAVDEWEDGDVLLWDGVNEALTDVAGTTVQAGHAVGDKAADATTADVALQPGDTDYVDPTTTAA